MHYIYFVRSDNAHSQKHNIILEQVTITFDSKKYNSNRFRNKNWEKYLYKVFEGLGILTFYLVRDQISNEK